MTAERQDQTLIERMEQDPVRSLDLAAARLGVQVSVLLNQAREQSGMTGRVIAERLGVTEGRVSQVLRGNGNLPVAALARYLGAMGYEITIAAIPRAAGTMEDLPLCSSGRRDRRLAGEGIAEPEWTVVPDQLPSGP